MLDSNAILLYIAYPYVVADTVEGGCAGWTENTVMWTAGLVDTSVKHINWLEVRKRCRCRVTWVCPLLPRCQMQRTGGICPVCSTAVCKVPRVWNCYRVCYSPHWVKQRHICTALVWQHQLIAVHVLHQRCTVCPCKIYDGVGILYTGPVYRHNLCYFQLGIHAERWGTPEFLF